MPAIAIGDPPEGASTVLIDADQSAHVSEVTATMQGIGVSSNGWLAMRGVATRPLCSTPCAVHLPRGPHSLIFRRADGSWGGTAQLDVGMKPTAYRYAMGRESSGVGLRVGGIMALTFGFSAASTGLFFYAVGDEIGARSLATPFAVGGIGLTVLGAVLLYLGRPEVQNGSGVRWEVSEMAMRR